MSLRHECLLDSIGRQSFASVDTCLLCRKRMQDIELAGVQELYIFSKTDVLTRYEDLRQLVELRRKKYASLSLLPPILDCNYDTEVQSEGIAVSI